VDVDIVKQMLGVIGRGSNTTSKSSEIHRFSPERRHKSRKTEDTRTSTEAHRKSVGTPEGIQTRTHILRIGGAKKKKKSQEKRERNDSFGELKAKKIRSWTEKRLQGKEKICPAQDEWQSKKTGPTPTPQRKKRRDPGEKMTARVRATSTRIREKKQER